MLVVSYCAECKFPCCGRVTFVMICWRLGEVLGGFCYVFLLFLCKQIYLLVSGFSFTFSHLTVHCFGRFSRGVKVRGGGFFILAWPFILLTGFSAKTWGIANYFIRITLKKAMMPRFTLFYLSVMIFCIYVS